MLRASALLGLAVALAACSREAPARRALPGEGGGAGTAGIHPELEIPSDAPTVVFLGDSISAGLHLGADDAFPAELQRQLAAEGLPFQLVNAGVSGDTSAGGLRRIDWILSRHPAVVVVELGGNDGLRGQDVGSIEQNLRAIVRKAKDAGASVLLLGVQLPPSLGRDYVASFEALYPRIAAEEHVALVPSFMSGVGGVATLNLEDGLHPTAEGHRQLAATVLPELRKLVSELHASQH